MSRTGPPPKDDRARRNVDPAPAQMVDAGGAPKPDLPENDWPSVTIAWWEMLDSHPLRPTFTPTDWAFLLSTARIHAAFWDGDMKAASELRLRESKYAFTPEDRARMRIGVKPAAAGGPGVAPAAPRAAESPDRRERLLKAVQ